MPVTEQLENLVDRMPEPDGRGMYTEDVDKERIEKAIAAIAEGGESSVLGLIAMLGPPGSAENAKPHYALHCVVNHALVTGDEPLRKTICAALASQLGNRELHPYNRSYLCQELQWAGRDECCEALGGVLLDADVTDAAATALAAIGGPRAADQLRSAVERAEGKARRNLIDALATMAEPESATTFKQALEDSDREVRIAAASGLARLGRPEDADSMLDVADAAQGWERIQTTKACLALAENLAAAGNKPAATRVYRRLLDTRTGDAERHVREAARRGLESIA